MKALTLTQPWAQLMADGRKHIETRSWQANWMVGKNIAIHAAKGWKAEDRTFASAWGYDPETLPRSAIVAVVKVLDMLPTTRANPVGLEGAYGNFEPGRWAWITELVAKVEPPIEARGALGLWEVDLDDARRLQKLVTA